MRNNRTWMGAVVAAGLCAAIGCNNAPSVESNSPASTAANDAAEKEAAATRERSEKANELERRAADLDSQWTEMQTKIQTRGRAATAGLREEVQEDVKNAREAAAELKTTTPENWWERYEHALDQSVKDVQADVLRLTRQKTIPEPADTAEPVGTSAGFTERRDAFVSRLRARLDAMEEQLDKVKANGAVKTELSDTRARIDKLQDDLDGLKNVSADDWWDVSSDRVAQYIDRVQDSIKRLDDNAASANTRGAGAGAAR